MDHPTPQRKLDHLRVCTSHDVEFSCVTTLLEDVTLLHCALPEVNDDEVDLSTNLMGRRLAAPLLIGAATGGVQEARAINCDLARAAARLGIGMQLGSQRAMVERPALRQTYAVRDVAPDILLLGNIGLAQARHLCDEAIRSLVRDVGADGLCVHLNPAMELVQPEGDRDFRGGVDTLRRLSDLLEGRLIVKETGCGIGRRVAERLVRAGVRIIDVGGAGGSSWVRIEHLRASSDGPFSEWGIPTAACLLELRELDCVLIASGGLRNGVEIAKCLALGASLAAATLPFLRAQQNGGAEGIEEVGARLIAELRTASVLTGSRDLSELQRAEHVITGRLLQWQQARCRSEARHV